MDTNSKFDIVFKGLCSQAAQGCLPGLPGRPLSACLLCPEARACASCAERERERELTKRESDPNKRTNKSNAEAGKRRKEKGKSQRERSRSQSRSQEGMTKKRRKRRNAGKEVLWTSVTPGPRRSVQNGRKRLDALASKHVVQVLCSLLGGRRTKQKSLEFVAIGALGPAGSCRVKIRQMHRGLLAGCQRPHVRGPAVATAFRGCSYSSSGPPVGP